MKWSIIVSACLCILSLLAEAKALPIRRSASSSSSQDKIVNDELGDIVLFPYQEKLIEEYNKGTKKRGAGDKDIIKRWSNGIVPYVMDPKIVGTKYERSFNKAIDIWQKYTCIKFVNRSNERHFIKLTNSTLCKSSIGRPDDPAPPSYEVTLGPKCDAPGNAMHELGHVLGFFHEHQRPDRDDFITINEEEIDYDIAGDAFKKQGDYIDSLEVEYDYASIMHYSKRAFSKDGNDVFTIKEGKKLPKCLPEVGQRKTISRKDIEQVNKLYNCPAKKINDDLDDCALFNPPEIRKKNIKTTNHISLGLDENTWVTCRTGRCFKKDCVANFDRRKKRNTFATLNNVCTDHQFTLRTTITRARSDKVKVGDNITLEWKPGKFLDCSSVSGACSMTACSQMDFEGSNGAEECPNHIFQITSETKKVGDIVQTHDEIQLKYVRNGYYVDCSGAKCQVQHYEGCTAPSRATDDEEQDDLNDQIPVDQLNCKPPTFVIQK